VNNNFFLKTEFKSDWRKEEEEKEDDLMMMLKMARLQRIEHPRALIPC